MRREKGKTPIIFKSTLKVSKMAPLMAPFSRFALATLSAQSNGRKTKHTRRYYMAEALNSPEVIGPVGNNPFSNMQQRFGRLPPKNKIALLVGVPLLIAMLVSMLMSGDRRRAGDGAARRTGLLG